MAPWILFGPGLHWSTGLRLPPPGVSGTQAARQVQRGEAYHLQHADLLGRLDLFYSSLCQLSWKVHCGCGSICYISLQFWTVTLYFCAQMLYNSISASEKH